MKIYKYRIVHPDIDKEWFVSFSGRRNRDEVLRKFRKLNKVTTNANDDFIVSLNDTISDPFDDRLDSDGRTEAIKHEANVTRLKLFNII